ncbi:hypothetical protein L1987_15106 [Smallanthus sonchifolius]|uniref:Uncharacterized protein n=1 Tax=Smallanthus sonchifolius TaxID=185202 RepID=A0ACB9J4J5_9ASTR|nr:hypothetical protein L1987_15106 [Smallanthus sonchifolius]
MGYEGVFRHKTIRKCMLSSNWRYLSHIVLNCLSSRKSCWDDLSLQLASTVVVIATEVRFHFSGFDISSFHQRRKNHSRSTLSGNVTALFDNMLGFTDGASSSSSRSSSSSSESASDGSDSENGNHGDDEHAETIGDAIVIFEHEYIRTTQGSSPSPTPIREGVSSPKHSKGMPSWTVALQSLNEALQQAVEGLTTLFSSSSSSENSKRHGNKRIEGDEKGVSAENIVDDIEGGEPNLKNKLSKELEDELSRKVIEDIMSQDYYDEVNAQIQLEDNMAKVAASWLSSIIEDELRKKEIDRLRMEAMNVKRVYMKRMTLSVTTSEVKKPIQETAKEIPKPTPEIPKPTPEIPKHATTPLRKKSIAKRPFKRSEEAVTPDPTKYKVLYDSIDI